MKPRAEQTSVHLLGDWGAILDDLQLARLEPQPLGFPGPPGPRYAFGESGAPALEQIERELGPDSAFFFVLPAGASAASIARARNALWPALHVIAYYQTEAGVLHRKSLSGKRQLASAQAPAGTILAARSRRLVLSPEATVEKFDQNAANWNGEPGHPGYRHFRWMRRYVALQADPRHARRILDFGCGAGWVGIEAGLRAPQATLHAFDPSPEMVRIAAENARAAGLQRFVGRVGFGEAPPLPAEGEEPYDLVYSSGVISFSPAPEVWLDGLTRAVAPGGTLIIGDIHGQSHGMQRRKREKPLLPVRELNAQTRDEVRRQLERRGFRFEAWSAYQFSWPLPQLMHVNETRLGGVLTLPLLACNRLASFVDKRLGSPAQNLFDSWVMRLVRSRRT